MYEPPLFREDRSDVMHALIAAHPFATLVSTQDGALSADHLPLILQKGDAAETRLQGHIAAGNPLVSGGETELPVLAVFQGPQAYVSPSWYPSKQAHGKAVPTWNYAVVQAHGVLRFHRETDWLLRHLTALTERHETGRDDPWAVSDAPSDYLQRQLKGLVGIEISVTRLSGKWKVSQNKSQPDRAGVAQGLLGEGKADAGAVSQLVRERGG